MTNLPKRRGLQMARVQSEIAPTAKSKLGVAFRTREFLESFIKGSCVLFGFTHTPIRSSLPGEIR